jgi:uncharacterized membrane protein
MVSVKTTNKRHVRLALAILLLVFAFASFVLQPSNFAIRALGLLAILVSVWLVRISKVPTRSTSRLETHGEGSAGTGKRLQIIRSAVGVGALLAMGASFLYLYNDAVGGYQRELPVYVFAGTWLAGAVICGYLAVRILS